MYVKQTPHSTLSTLPAKLCVALGFTSLLFGLCGTASAQPQVIRNITQPTQRLELTVNTSRILTLDKRVPKMVVNNPELLSVTPISANQVQIAAKKPGVTQVNLWDEDGQVYTVDLLIYGDVRELEHALKRLFPESSVKVVRLTNSLVLEGFVERPEVVSPIVRLAEDYAPKIVNNITVGGVQQVLLKVKVMEVSRTKLRQLGVDWAQQSGGDFVASSVSGLLSGITGSALPTVSGATFQAFVDDGNFLTVLNALQQNNVAKTLADPTIAAVSGRPAQFNVGGELPIIIPSGIGQTTVEYKPFGTQVDFVPIVLGNGNIRLEVRPRISDIDDSRSVNIGQFSVPALTVRQVDTAVELKAGQTLALAGLVQTRIEAEERGLPFVSDIPVIGTAFRSVREEANEIELLILVTPELVDGLDPHEVPPCGPGTESVSPTNCQLYFGSHIEVPSLGPCGPNGSYGCGGAGCGRAGCHSCDVGSSVGVGYASDAVPTAVGSDYQTVPLEAVQQSQPEYIDTGLPTNGVPATNLQLPAQSQPAGPLQLGPEPTAQNQVSEWQQAAYGHLRQQVPETAQRPRTGGTSTPGLIGPLGYDVE